MERTTSLLNYILGLLTKNDNEKERKALQQYDRMKFIDVNKEIKKSHASKEKVKA